MRRLLLLVVLGAAVASCTAGEGAASEDAGSLSATVALVDGHALLGRLHLEHAAGEQVEVRVRGEERSFEVPVDPTSTDQEVPIAGLRAESDYVVEVRAGDEVVELDLRTGPLPSELDPIEVVTAEPGRMSPGFTLFNVLDGTDQLSDAPPAAEPSDAGLLVAVDDRGHVVWYLRTPHPIGDVRQLPDGTFLHEYNDTGARRIDLFGTVLDEWAGQIITGPLATDAFGRRVTGDDPVRVDTDSMHHEVYPLPDGNLVTVSTELRTVDGFDRPLCGEDPADFDGTYDLISDVIVEFTPDGDVVARHPLADLLDPVTDPRDQNVCGLPFDEVFPNWLYRAQGHADALDWTHANAVVPDPSGEAFTVSVRHLDAVLQIDRATGELRWRLGPGGDFAIDDPAQLPYHQHAVEWQDDGTLLLYDNGNGRPGTAGPTTPDLPPPYSRAVQYRLDPDDGTAEVVWEHVSQLAGAPVFASFVGDADRLPNGNVLITHGGIGDGHPSGVTAQIIEVVPDPSGSGGPTVFDLRLADPDRSLTVYRAERIPSLYG